MMLHVVLAVAEAGVDLIGGGWVGTGLLGAVLSWLLLKHIPDKDRMIAQMIQASDARDDRRRAEDRELRRAEREGCKEDHRLLAEGLLANTRETVSLAQQTKAIGDAMHKLADSWVKISRDRPTSPGGH